MKMDSTKQKLKKQFRKGIDAIINRDFDRARKYIQEGIQQNPKYVDYKNTLSEMGFLFETVEVPEEVYFKIQEILKGFPKAVKLKVLDECWKMIKNEN